MLGILLVGIGQIFGEIGTSIGKYEAARNKESLYAMGFLSAFWATLLLGLLALFGNQEFIFSLESLPTFMARAVLEIALVFVTLHAVCKADRSTFSFLHGVTLPILLGIDLVLGYVITTTQFLGMAVLIVTILLLLSFRGLSKNGKILSIVAGVLAAGTTALYKYDITHFNSVAAEQTIMHVLILVTLVGVAKVRTGENVFRYLTHRPFFIQSFASGVASVCISYAYVFAPASVILAAKRSFEVFIAIISGRFYFHEKHLPLKLVALVLTVIAIGLIVVQI